MNNKNKGTLFNSIPAMGFFPLFIFGMVSILFTSVRFAQVMAEQVEIELKEIADSVLLTYDVTYPGKYELENFQVDGQTVVALMKGDKEITGDTSIIDRYKESTGAEISLFYRENRMITTLQNASGERMAGSPASVVVIRDVMEGQKSTFYRQVKIDTNTYYCFYEPILTPSGGCIGMVAVAKPASEVNLLITKSMLPSLILIMIAMAITLFVSHRFASSLANAIANLNKALAAVAKGELSKEPDYSVMSRDDEIGQMGKSVVTMQKSLHNLIEKDALTELYNRRLATKRLNKIIKNSSEMGTKFCVCLGDIDFFKKVNDTYGHDCGDLVLKGVSAVFRKNMAGKGFAARWGGEEFLIVYDNTELSQAKGFLEEMLDEIRAMEIKDEVGDRIIKVTMTFGIVPGVEGADMDTLVRMSDELLYEGKTGGRNRIVVKPEEENSENNEN